MKKHTTFLSLILISGLLIPVSGSAHHYRQTANYQSLVSWANSLKGISFNDSRYIAYCDSYAQASALQANRRVSEGCSSAIPTNNAALQNRWSNNVWGHKGWCRSVSAHASLSELNIRESGLRNCLSRHTPVNNNAQIRRNCLAGDALHKKAAGGDVNFVRNCLNAGVNVNTVEGNGWTALHSAARSGRLQIVKLLLSNGANINAVDVTGRTPLDQAIAGKYPTVQNYLRSQGGF